MHDSIFEKWLDAFSEKAQRLVYGDPKNENTEISVMIDEAAAIRTDKWLIEAVDHGAKIVCGGNRTGKFVEPTVVTNTGPEMKIVSEEVFAPVVVVERCSSIEDAVNMANQGKYGLQAGVFTQDLNNARLASEGLEYGGVIINDVPSFRVDNMPYGGIKDSGFGREGVRYAMEEMTEPKLIVNSF